MVNAKKICQDGAIVHLTEDGMQKHKVPDDHVMPHVRTLQDFEREGFFFLRSKILNSRGVILSGDLTITLSTMR